eukprot:8702320-Pyramimonas_sp.AAC.1
MAIRSFQNGGGHRSGQNSARQQSPTAVDTNIWRTRWRSISVIPGSRGASIAVQSLASNSRDHGHP